MGTIDSLWESNMDLLNPKMELDLNEDSWKIYSRNPVLPPHYIGKDAKVQDSLITEGCNVYGEIDFTVLFDGVNIGSGAVVHSIVMPGATIEDGAVSVRFAIIGENVVIGKNAVIGARPEDMENVEEWGVTVIGADCNIPSGVVIAPKEMIDAETYNKEAGK